MSYREALDLERAPAGDDGAGGLAGAWTVIARVLAEVHPVSGRELGDLIAAGQLNGYRVRCRPCGATSGDRFRWTPPSGGGAQLLDIRSVLPNDRYGRWVEIMCEGRPA